MDYYKRREEKIDFTAFILLHEKARNQSDSGLFHFIFL